MSDKVADGVIVLSDGSAFSVVAIPLPKDHWLYAEYIGPPPMTIRAGTGSPYRKELIPKIIEAARYAVRASTDCGNLLDFDPDALVQNMIIALLGYYTEDGLGSESWQNPSPVPKELK